MYRTPYLYGLDYRFSEFINLLIIEENAKQLDQFDKKKKKFLLVNSNDTRNGKLLYGYDGRIVRVKNVKDRCYLIGSDIFSSDEFKEKSESDNPRFTTHSCCSKVGIEMLNSIGDIFNHSKIGYVILQDFYIDGKGNDKSTEFVNVQLKVNERIIEYDFQNSVLFLLVDGKNIDTDLITLGEFNKLKDSVYNKIEFLIQFLIDKFNLNFSEELLMFSKFIEQSKKVEGRDTVI
ncbi:MAG: hypothetical protein J7604_25925 [Sporocytophaga sp.]|uniref:hypothetical protein n=1 Tax=Sporocytophaga sp. TaxID=2231183 RepID=UPI001B171BDF|nr:hypothetical protein [Sporocytophaga sp.]MBO9703670.1 hypothetical protein [Sporocytophaga sp.]